MDHKQYDVGRTEMLESWRAMKSALENHRALLGERIAETTRERDIANGKIAALITAIDALEAEMRKEQQ